MPSILRRSSGRTVWRRKGETNSKNKRDWVVNDVLKSKLNQFQLAGLQILRQACCRHTHHRLSFVSQLGPCWNRAPRCSPRKRRCHANPDRCLSGWHDWRSNYQAANEEEWKINWWEQDTWRMMGTGYETQRKVNVQILESFREFKERFLTFANCLL